MRFFASSRLAAFWLAGLLSLSSHSLVAQEAPELLPDPAVSNDQAERLDQILAGDEIPRTIDDLRGMQEHISRLAERVRRATVAVNCGGAEGSGVIVSPDGLVLTAAHVIGAPDLDASIRLEDGTIVAAKTRGLVNGLDSGLIKIVEPGPYPYLDLGQSSTLKLGQWVMALGHPGGYEQDRGIVVRVGRVLASTRRVIRSDCTLVGGDSGGPLVSMAGEIIGIHSRIGARLSDNLHVPVDVFSEGWDDLEAGQASGIPMARPNLGVTLKGEEGLEIEAVQPSGPAEKAGVRTGDVILEINGTDVNTREQLSREIEKLEIGTEMELKVLRETEELKLNLVVGGRG